MTSQGGVKLPSLSHSASTGALPRIGNEGNAPTLSVTLMSRPASQAEFRQPPMMPPDSPATPKLTNLVMVKFRGDHGMTLEGTRVTGSVLQAWMLGVRPGWTIITIAGQQVQTKEDVDEALQQAAAGDKRYEVCFQKNQGKFGTEAKEKAEKEKRYHAKLRKEFKFQGIIERTEHRSITYRHLERVLGFVEEHISGWYDTATARLSKTAGKPLRMDILNHHHLNAWVILPVTQQKKASFVEMLVNQGQVPVTFVSHWWGEPVINFVESLKTHITTRGLSFESPYWIAAYAGRQIASQSEMRDDVRKTGFFKALEAAKYNMLLILDAKARSFSRLWCMFELSLCQDQEDPPIDIVLNFGAKAEIITRGLTNEDEMLELQSHGLGVRSKVNREASFPIDWVIEKGLSVTIEKCTTAKDEDRASILNFIAQRELSEVPFEEHQRYHQLNSRLRGMIAAAIWQRTSMAEDSRSLTTRGLWSKVASTFAEDTSRDHFTLHSEGVDSDAFSLLVNNLPSDLHELKLFLRSSSIKNEDMTALANALPKELATLSLDFRNCHNLSDAGISALAKRLDFDTQAVYIKLADTKVSKDVQDWYAAEATRCEDKAQGGQSRNVERALGVSLCRKPEMIDRSRQRAVPAVKVLGSILADEGAGEFRAFAALRAINTMGDKAKQSLDDVAATRFKELQVEFQTREAERKAREAEKKAKDALKKAAQ